MITLALNEYPKGAFLEAYNVPEMEEMRAMIANHWSANVGRASREQIEHWQDMIDRLSALINKG